MIFARFLVLALPVLLASQALAETTKIDVRVLSKGAKFVGSSMGGVEVVIKDYATGELLAKGVTEGTTGDTERIMKQAQVHHALVATADAAVFHASVELDEPRQLEITARGPLAQQQALNVVSTTQWVVPGKHLTGGDGLRLELPGFVVDVLDPPAHQSLTSESKSVTLRANVLMMCGCPIEPGGLWDADTYEVTALVTKDGKRLKDVPLRYAGSTSQFEADVPLEGPGVYQITVYAFDPANGNTGVDKTTFRVEK